MRQYCVDALRTMRRRLFGKNDQIRSILRQGLEMRLVFHGGARELERGSAREHEHGRGGEDAEGGGVSQLAEVHDAP